MKLTNVGIATILMSALPLSIFGQLEIKTTLSGGIEESIKVHMLPFYGYEGDWRVLVKEVTPSNDTVEFQSKAGCTITRDSTRIKKDSAEVVFRFTWNSAATLELMDMKSIRISYSWDAEKYFVTVQHEPKISPANPGVTLLSSSSCSPQLNFDTRELFFVASINDNSRRIMLNEWKLGDNRIVLLHREAIGNTGKFRTRRFFFERD